MEDGKKNIDEPVVLQVNDLKTSVETSTALLYAWERRKHIDIVVTRKRGDFRPWMLYHSQKDLPIKSPQEAVSHLKNQDKSHNRNLRNRNYPSS